MDIYVGNLPYAAMDDDLKQLFETYGSVKSARVVIDRMSGRSKGFGFVEMDQREEADKAIENLDGSDFMGRDIRVNEARPRAPRTERPRNDGFRSERW
jgi:RNA recognition motif-containing protein